MHVKPLICESPPGESEVSQDLQTLTGECGHVRDSLKGTCWSLSLWGSWTDGLKSSLPLRLIDHLAALWESDFLVTIC